MLRFSWPTAVAWADVLPGLLIPTFPGSQRAVCFGQLRCKSAGRAFSLVRVHKSPGALAPPLPHRPVSSSDID